MESNQVLVYGGSGHAKVVIDIIEQQGKCRIAGLIDDNPKLQGQKFCGYRIVGGFDQLNGNTYKSYQIIIAVGENRVRKKLCKKLVSLEYQFITVVHPSAQIGRSVSISSGTTIMANVVVNPDTKVGAHVILNTGATIDHDCVIGDFVHISPGVHIAGNVVIGELSHIGIGVNIIQGVKIGENSLIGAGAAVVEDIPDDVIAVGVPAKVIKNKRRVL